jgi:hypothetical protein
MSETTVKPSVLLAVYDPAFQAVDGSYWTWHAPELDSRLLATTYYELLAPAIPLDPNELSVDQLWAGMGDVSEEWRCYFRFVNGGRDQRGRPGRFVILCAFVSRSDSRFVDTLELLQGQEFERLAQRARTECPLSAGQLQLSLESAPTNTDPVLLAKLIAAGRLQDASASSVQRVAQLIPGLPTDRCWQATLRDLNGEQRAEIWRQEPRVDRPQGDQPSQSPGQEPAAPAALPVNNRFSQRVLVSLITPAVVAALAAYGQQWLRLSALQTCFAVGLLGLLGLIWLMVAKSSRSRRQT